MAVLKTLRNRSGDTDRWKIKDGPRGQSCGLRFRGRIGNGMQCAAVGAQVEGPWSRGV